MSEPPRRSRRWTTLAARLLDEEHLWSVLALIAIVTIAGTEFGSVSLDYAIGDIAEADIVAPIELRVPDPETTGQRREDARRQVADVYDFDPFAWQAPVQSLNALYAWGRGSLGDLDSPVWTDLSDEQRVALREEAEATFGLPLPDGFVAAAWAEGFSAETELAAERLLRNQLQHALVGTLNSLNFGESSSVQLRDIADQRERTLGDLGTVRDLRSAQDWVVRQIEADFALRPVMQVTLGELLIKLIRPNVTFNSNETQARRQAAEDTVDLVFYQVQRGRTIVRIGDPVTEQAALELAALRQQWAGGSGSASSAGFSVVVALVLFGLWRYVRYRRQRIRVQRVRRLYHLLLVILVATVLMTRMMLFIGDAVAGSFMAPPFDLAGYYRFAIPFAAGALALVLLADAEVAWIYAALQAVLVGAMTGDAELTVYSLLGSFAVVFGMTRLAERTAMLHAVVTLSIVNGLAVVGLALLQVSVPPWSFTTFQVILAGVGALQAVLLASAVLPPLEWLFDTLTDIKLLELSNMNLPLLKQLAVVAPGTYHHSVVVGTLSEKGAEAIGANPLFCRVASYYHDIGKMRQPEYFIENQKEGVNPHEKLSPHMSALILVRHVKEGVVLADEYGLPRPLADAIPQHHGTAMMRFFLQRARKSQGDEVREDDFRYPGPKPQTKETALIMLADGVEARSRLVEDPSSRNLQEMIHDQVRNVLEDEQLDECDITLRDLAKVEEAFLDVLSGMRHNRIEYPESVDRPVVAANEAAQSP